MNTPANHTPPPAPPSPPPEPPTPPPAAAEPAPPGTTDDRNLAMLVHLSGILFSVIVPLIAWLVCKDDSSKRYLSEQSKEALNFQIAVLIAYIISWVLTIILIGVLLGFLVWIANLVFCIIAAIKVSSDGSYSYPFTLRLIK